jgi:hypothetical protein
LRGRFFLGLTAAGAVASPSRFVSPFVLGVGAVISFILQWLLKGRPT